jgi:catechol 2,3-dioxygenase-like lactoylglutathione lyase family enzyme
MSETIVPILRVADGPATAAWYERLDFTVVDEHRFAPDLPRYVFLRRGDVWVHLSEHAGDAPPGSLVYLDVDDVERIAADFGVPMDEQPWAREVELTDPDGNRLRIGQVRT